MTLNILFGWFLNLLQPILVMTLWRHLFSWRPLDQMIVSAELIGPSSASISVELLFSSFFSLNGFPDPSCITFIIRFQNHGFLHYNWMIPLYQHGLLRFLSKIIENQMKNQNLAKRVQSPMYNVVTLFQEILAGFNITPEFFTKLAISSCHLPYAT